MLRHIPMEVFQVVGDLEKMIESVKPNMALVPGGWEPKPYEVPSLDDPTDCIFLSNHAMLIKNALSWSECDLLMDLMNLSPKMESVSIQGRKDVPDYRIGSTRTSIWSSLLAEQLWKKLKIYLSDREHQMHKRSPTDWWQGNKNRTGWTPIGLTPMFRFMRYDAGGQHYAHYDAGFIYPDDNYRTLKSVVIYLTTNKEGGATRFIEDDQGALPIWDRKHEDWTREAYSKEVITKVQPRRGNILVFDHRLCHDVETFTGIEPRIIIRADLLFKSDLYE